MARLRLPRALKLGATVAVSSFYAATCFTAENLLGWSAPVAVPEHFQLLSTRVIEPTPRKAKPAPSIYGWKRWTMPTCQTACRARHTAPPGGDPSGGGLLDPAFLGGQSKSVELEPLPPPALPPKDDP